MRLYAPTPRLQADPDDSVRSSGQQRDTRHDPAARRQSKRHGRERGCWVYLPGSVLEQAGLSVDAPPPSYRTWPGTRGGVFLRLYGGRR